MNEPSSADQMPMPNSDVDPAFPDNLDELFALGQHELDEGQFVAAQHAFEKALTIDPAHLVAHHNLGYALECQGLVEEAIAAYAEASHSPLPLAPSCFNLGVLLSRVGRDQEAKQAFERTLARDPTFAKAWVNLGVLYNRSEDLNQARQCYEKALEVEPSCLSARLKMANLKARESQWEEALAAYAELLKEGWNPAEVQYRRGLVLMARGDDREALQAFEQALEVDADHLSARVQLALLAAQREDYDHAMELLQRAASLAPENALIQYNLGNMHARKAVERQEIVNYGYADAAMRAYRRSIELDPHHLKAYYNLACIAEKISVQEGITAWERYLEVARAIPTEQEWRVRAQRYLRSLKEAESAS